MAAHARLKNEFREDERYHNLMSWLMWSHVVSLGHFHFRDFFLAGFAPIRMKGHKTQLKTEKERSLTLCFHILLFTHSCSLLGFRV